MRGIVALVAALASLHVFQSDARGEERFSQNLANCTAWREIEGNLSVRNACDRLVTIQFITSDTKYVIIRTLERDEQVITRVKMKTARKLGWIASACPAGFKPTIELTITNRQKFVDNSYDCVRI